jgi:isopentenyldiphosphate isomerase
MKEEILSVVDENDNIIGEKPRKEVEENNLIHRSANIIVENDKGELFVHQRTITRFLYPGMWDTKVGGAVSAGESYEETAKRELGEEIGIKDVELEFLFNQRFRSEGHNANKKIFLCKSNGPMKLQEEEVEQGRFMTFDEIRGLEKEGKLSPTAKKVFDDYLEYKNKIKMENQ